jgi:hypothetical protein
MFAVMKTFLYRYLNFYWKVTMPKPHIKSFLPVEAEISVTKVFITANMQNSKSRGKQEVDVR